MNPKEIRFGNFFFKIGQRAAQGMLGSAYHMKHQIVAEAFDMGYEEYFYSGDLCLVEWPERVEELLPDDVMIVRIEPLDETTRKFTIE